MSLQLASLPLAWLAGVVSVLSPCVWPLVPVVVSSAATGGRSGPYFLAMGLATAFGVAGTFLTLLLLTLGLDPELFRYIAAGLLIAVSVPLLLERVGDWLTLRLARLTGRLQVGGGGQGYGSPAGQFGVGALLGLVWLPCVGPTLGAAITLASLGQSLAMAFTVMFAFGIGTASVLLAAGLVSSRALARARPALLSSASRGKTLLGGLLLILGVSVLTGLDKVAETWAVGWMPTWVFAF